MKVNQLFVKDIDNSVTTDELASIIETGEEEGSIDEDKSELLQSAIDFSETVNYDYQGEGDFQWLNNNCHKYGFIVRYTEEKESITKYRKEPWHFRDSRRSRQ